MSASDLRKIHEWRFLHEKFSFSFLGTKLAFQISKNQHIAHTSKEKKTRNRDSYLFVWVMHEPRMYVLKSFERNDNDKFLANFLGVTLSRTVWICTNTRVPFEVRRMIFSKVGRCSTYTLAVDIGEPNDRTKPIMMIVFFLVSSH